MLQAEPPRASQAGWQVLRRLLLVLLAWSAAAFAVLANAAVTRIGPVIYQINDRHGVHAGDVLVGTGMFCLAVLVTAALLWPRPGSY